MIVYYKRYPCLLETPKADFRFFISIFYNKKAANFVKFAAFLLISSPPFLVYARNILYICCNIISFKSLVSYSFICYLQGLDSFFDYKDTTFKSICQEIHLIKYLLQAFIKSIVLLLLTFYATNSINFMNVIPCLFDGHAQQPFQRLPPSPDKEALPANFQKTSSSVEIQRPATNRFV